MSQPVGQLIESEPTDKVCAALVAAQGEFPIVLETGENKFDKYNYAKLEDYIRTVQPVLAKHKLAICFNTISLIPEEKHTTEKGKLENNFVVCVEAQIIHNSGQRIKFLGYGQGIDRGDKAIYKATTGARKYLLASILNLATSEDPENDGREDYQQQNQQQSAPPKQAEKPKPAPQQEAAKQAPPKRDPDQWDALTEEELGPCLEMLSQLLAEHYKDKGNMSPAKIIQDFSNQVAGNDKDGNPKKVEGAYHVGFFYAFALGKDEVSIARHQNRMLFLRALCRKLDKLAKTNNLQYELPIADALPF